MASATKQTEKRRKMKRSNMGKTRKARERNQGTTKSYEELFGDK